MRSDIVYGRFTGTVYSARAGHNLYGTDVEVDYRGEEVTVENFIRLLTGRHYPATPRSKRLLSDHQSNVLIYLTGHGGDSFLKFQDTQELTNVDLAYAIQTMYEDNRYHEMFLIADTCRSASMFEWISSPGVLSSSSSLSHEESYSYDVDDEIGVYVIDRYTHFTVSFLNREVKALNSTATMQDYLDSCSRRQCLSTVEALRAKAGRFLTTLPILSEVMSLIDFVLGVRKDVYPKEPSRVRVTDFFGSSRIIRQISEEIIVDDDWLHR
ncbi:peptidase C13 family protein [Dictyocaulus viviparus]|uniref:Peptidase C13 family protein n=1 Tax=Dictyocaulus viviparus TaxID=29172 RepID=A0A0D8XWT2_DICVI|nr:peptidase C13 family protein [Dictyocaulus viviparus]